MEKNLINIIKDIVLKQNVDFSVINVSWEDFELICKKHDLLGLVGNYIGKYAPENIKKSFIEGYTFSLMRNSLFDQEIKKISSEFNEKKISFMVLKGNVMKKYYPSPELRSMGDIDILVHKENIDEVKHIMENLGYLLKLERSDEITFSKGWLINVEMHTQMVSDSHTNINSYYGDGWKFAVLKKDCCYEYEMTKNDFFIFQVVHFAKHYASSGVGIRPIIDIWILLKEWEVDLNWNYIYSQLEFLNLRKFAESVFDLIKMWFEGGERTAVLNDMEEYVFNCGVHGSIIQSSACKEAKSKNIYIHKIKKYIRAVFISKRDLKEMYPVLINKPFLVPYYQIKRIIQKLFNGSVKNYYDKEIALKKEYDIVKLKNHFNDLGL